MKLRKIPGAKVEAWLQIHPDRKTSILALCAGRTAVAFIEQPETAETCDRAMDACMDELTRELDAGPRLGDMVTKIDRTTGQFWLNNDIGPFAFAVKP